MKYLSELISELQEILDEIGECKVYYEHTSHYTNEEILIDLPGSNYTEAVHLMPII